MEVKRQTFDAELAQVVSTSVSDTYNWGVIYLSAYLFIEHPFIEDLQFISAAWILGTKKS